MSKPRFFKETPQQSSSNGSSQNTGIVTPPNPPTHRVPPMRRRFYHWQRRDLATFHQRVQQLPLLELMMPEIELISELNQISELNHRMLPAPAIHNEPNSAANIVQDHQVNSDSEHPSSPSPL